MDAEARKRSARERVIAEDMLHVVARGVQQAFEALGISASNRDAIQVADLVVLAMCGEHRVYHDMRHVFEVAPEDPTKDPLGFLAAVFHDIVQIKADGEISPLIHAHLRRGGVILLPSHTSITKLRDQPRRSKRRAGATQQKRPTLSPIPEENTACIDPDLAAPVDDLPTMMQCDPPQLCRRVAAMSKPHMVLTMSQHELDAVLDAEGPCELPVFSPHKNDAPLFERPRDGVSTASTCVSKVAAKSGNDARTARSATTTTTTAPATATTSAPSTRVHQRSQGTLEDEGCAPDKLSALKEVLSWWTSRGTSSDDSPAPYRYYRDRGQGDRHHSHGHGHGSHHGYSHPRHPDCGYNDDDDEKGKDNDDHHHHHHHHHHHGQCNSRIHQRRRQWKREKRRQHQREDAQRMCREVFGHGPATVLDFSPDTPGLSEFLSCTVAMDVLAPWLDDLELLHVCTCIEATIPFRDPGCLDDLRERCRHAIQEDKAHFTPTKAQMAALTHTMVESACRMSLRDLSNFAVDDTREFLVNMWALLIENNSALKTPEAFTLRDWIQSLSSNLSFCEFLAREPSRIFMSFGDCPGQFNHLRLLTRARANLERALMYTAARLVTAGILHALLVAGGLHPDTMPVVDYLPQGMGGCVPASLLGMPPSGSERFGCIASTCDFHSRTLGTREYVEGLLQDGFAHEDRTGIGTDAEECPFSSACEASLFVFRQTAMRRGHGSPCFEQTLAAALAYVRGQASGRVFLSSVPLSCTKFVAERVVMFSLNDTQRQVLGRWVSDLPSCMGRHSPSPLSLSTVEGTVDVASDESEAGSIEPGVQRDDPCGKRRGRRNSPFVWYDEETRGRPREREDRT